MSIKGIRALAIVLIALGNMTGCVGYRLGSTLPPDIKTIFVPTFINKCNEPLIEVEATNATIAEFQKDGTLKIADANTADVILDVTLQSVGLTPLRYDRSDRSKPNEYRMTVSVSFVLRRNGTDEVLGESTTPYGETTFLFGGNLTTAKRNAMPNAAEDLAKRIVEQVVEIW